MVCHATTTVATATLGKGGGEAQLQKHEDARREPLNTNIHGGPRMSMIKRRGSWTARCALAQHMPHARCKQQRGMYGQCLLACVRADVGFTLVHVRKR